MKPSYKFILRTDKKNQQNKVPVYLRVLYNRRKSIYNTGIKISEKDWNDRREEVRSSHPSAEVLNQELDKIKLDAQKIGFKLEHKKGISAKKIVEELKGNQPEDFYKYAEGYCERYLNKGNITRVKKTRVILNKMREQYDQQFQFSDIDVAFLEDLEHKLRNEYGNHQNTVRKDLRMLKAIFVEAFNNKTIIENPFDRYKMPPRQKSKKEALDIGQIRAIEKLALKEGSDLYHIRNYFMFSFYNAGIRFGDLCRLTWENVQDGRLKYMMSKSRKNREPKYKNIKLSDQSYAILKDYRTSGTERDFIFPILDTNKDLSDPIIYQSDKASKNAMINSGLKEIAKLAEIETHVSFHISRHSFARHAANMGMNMYAISNALAHSDLKTTEVYLKGFNENLLDKEMENLF